MPEIHPEIPGLLTAWFEQNGRSLPWRKNRDPYRVWLSEIMLQQTRIGTVIDYFHRFTERFPDVQTLAAATDDEVMPYWAGLGYYQRMRNLHACAQTVVRDHGGKFPQTAEELKHLPGIGEYTSGAIASIAFDEPVPAVDGNVLRVLSRLSAWNGWNSKNASAALKKIYPAGKAGCFTQSLMELGELICIPAGEPLCVRCPLAELCLARKQKTIADYPAKKIKKPRKIEKIRVLILRNDGKIAVRKRPDKGILAGLPELPNEPEAHRFSPEKYGTVLRSWKDKHIFSHVEWHITAVEILAKEPFSKFQWTDEKTCPLPTAFRKLLKK